MRKYLKILLFICGFAASGVPGMRQNRNSPG